MAGKQRPNRGIIAVTSRAPECNRDKRGDVTRFGQEMLHNPISLSTSFFCLYPKITGRPCDAGEKPGRPGKNPLRSRCGPENRAMKWRPGSPLLSGPLPEGDGAHVPRLPPASPNTSVGRAAQAPGSVRLRLSADWIAQRSNCATPAAEGLRGDVLTHWIIPKLSCIFAHRFCQERESKSQHRGAISTD